MKRTTITELARRKDAMVSSLWSNPNFDDDKNTRANAIQELEDKLEEAIYMVHNGPEAEAEIDEDNPFFAQAKKGQEKIYAPRNDEGTVAENIIAEDLVKLDQ